MYCTVGFISIRPRKQRNSHLVILQIRARRVDVGSTTLRHVATVEFVPPESLACILPILGLRATNTFRGPTNRN